MPGTASSRLSMAELFAGAFGGADPLAASRRYEAWLAGYCPLDKDALKEKHARMAADDFAFLRAAFFRWSWHCRDLDARLARAPRVLAIGDVHLENFGTWRDAEGRLVWGVNDVDEAAALPFTSDLVRLAASALMEARRRPTRFLLAPDEVAEPILDGYRTGAARGGRPFVLEGEHSMLRDLAAVSGAAAAAEWAALATKPKAQPIVEATAGAAAARLRSALPAEATNLRWFRRTSGLGSLGRPRFLVIAEWRGGPIAREAKAAAPSAATPTADPGAAATRLLASAIRAPDPLFSIQDGWVVRRLGPDARKIEVKDLEAASDQRRLLRAMGREVANLHLGTPGAAALLRSGLAALGADSAWLHEAATTACRAVAADRQAFAAAQ